MDALNSHFQNIHSLIQQGKTRALAAATAHALESYWNIGAYLSLQLSENTYGKKVVNQLAEWLQTQEPGIKGFDWRSLYRMREFFEQWQNMDWSLAGLPQAIDNRLISQQLDASEKILGSLLPILPSMPLVLTRLSWTHHLEILKRCTSPEEKLFYLVLSIRERYKVRELLDRDVRKPHENPSIGVLLCKSKNEEVVEIAMSRQMSPTLVSVYETKFLDKNLLRRMLQRWSEDWEQQRS